VACWLGVDVGGKRKGFDIALIDNRRIVSLASRLDCGAVVELVEIERPAIVAIDAPRSCASFPPPPGPAGTVDAEPDPGQTGPGTA
jgi:predicted nuclease with RNAse H fold